MALFGSKAKNTTTETSDYDFIISKGKIQSLFQLASFIDELEKVFGQNVDVITDTSNDIVAHHYINLDYEIVQNTSVQIFPDYRRCYYLIVSNNTFI